MPNFVNNNDHPVRVDDGTGALRRLTPGQVVTASGAYADNLTATAGVATASEGDLTAWDARNDNTLADNGPDELLSVDPGPAMAAIARDTISKPLQVVVGDDAAPHGPGTGVITTRDQANADGDALAKLAFPTTGIAQAAVEGATGQTAKKPEALVTASAVEHDKVQLPKAPKGRVRQGEHSEALPPVVDESAGDPPPEEG